MPDAELTVQETERLEGAEWFVTHHKLAPGAELTVKYLAVKTEEGFSTP